jgi:hypothetical protein
MSTIRDAVRGGAPAAHYIAILLRSEIGEWRLVFPDAPDCEARGFSVHDATAAGITILTHCAQRRGAAFPRPRDLAEIEQDTDWLTGNRLDLGRSVITMIPLMVSAERA